jgi:hypothetical protein
MGLSRFTKRVCCLLVALGVPGVGHAADANREYRVRATNKVDSCAALNRAVVAAKQEDDWRALYGFSLYMQGYLSALNRLAYDTYDIGGKSNSKTILVWLENYCEENPDDSFDTALTKMSAEFFPNRYTIKPQ